MQVLDGAADGKIVRCPVTLYVGNRDEHTADAGLQGWAAFTRGPCALQVHAHTALRHDALVGSPGTFGRKSRWVGVRPPRRSGHKDRITSQK